MHDLLMGALHGAAADSIAQPKIFVIAHAPGIFTVVVDERLQALPQLRRFRTETLQSDDHRLYFSGAQILGDGMHPVIGLCGTFPITKLSEFPSMFQSVPEVEDFATVHKHGGAIPDPF